MTRLTRWIVGSSLCLALVGAPVARAQDTTITRQTALQVAQAAKPTATSCDTLIGTWKWSWGRGEAEKGKGDVTIMADGEMSGTGNKGTWKCTGTTATFTWSASIDTLEIKSSTKLEGTSNKGDWVKAEKQ